jgi:hypothetical protein
MFRIKALGNATGVCGAGAVQRSRHYFELWLQPEFSIAQAGSPIEGDVR